MSNLKMPNINYVIIAGNLTKDPTYRTTTNGTPVANFFMASSRKFKDNAGQWREEVCYIGIVAWHKLADSVNDNLFKGSAVLVDGELQSRSLKTDNGQYRNIIEIKARRIQFLNKRPSVSESDEAVLNTEDKATDFVNVKENEFAKKTEGTENPEISVSNEGTAGSEVADEEKKPSINFGYDNLKF